MKARRFRELYGSGPLHVVAIVASFSLAAYALLQLLDQPTGLNVALWLGAAVIGHDLVLLPLYSVLAAIAYRGLDVARGEPARVTALNHLRVPAMLSGLALLVWFPLVLRLSDRYERATALSIEPYLGRWLLLTGSLFTLSAVAFAVRVRRLRAGRG
jgi:hypothetical protein